MSEQTVGQKGLLKTKSIVVVQWPAIKKACVHRVNLGTGPEGYQSSDATPQSSEAPPQSRKRAVAGSMGTGTGEDELRLIVAQRSERARPEQP